MIISAGLAQGKIDKLAEFIIIYVILEGIIRGFSIIIAAYQEKEASKVIRVFELNKKGLAIHQIAEILENEGYRSTRGRGKLEKSIIKIVEKGNLTKALELKQLGFTTLYHKHSKHALGVLLRFFLVLISCYFIILPSPAVKMINLVPEPQGPVEVGSKIIWDIKISSEEKFLTNGEFEWEIYVNGKKRDNGETEQRHFHWPWKTAEEKNGAGMYTIMVKVWPKGYPNNDMSESESYELLNKKPKIENFISYPETESNPWGTCVTFTVDAYDHEDDDLFYEF